MLLYFLILDMQKNNTDYINNSLANSILWGRGFSIDYVTYYDKLLRIEFSINDLCEQGVFLNCFIFRYGKSCFLFFIIAYFKAVLDK